MVRDIKVPTKEISGVRFGRLVAQWPVGRDSNFHWWLCLCDCGTLRIVRKSFLGTGNSKSCGCLQREKASLQLREHHPFKHGHAHKRGETRTYHSWGCMMERCYGLSSPSRRWYGGRGIIVCSRWRGDNGFVNFLEDMGVRPLGRTLDRIDVDGNYEPGNCRWATPKEQAANKRKK